MNYIIEYKRKGDKVAYDFDRIKNTSIIAIEMYIGKLYANNKDIKGLMYHIWKADEDCYKRVGVVPVVSGGVDGCVAQYGNKG